MLDDLARDHDLGGLEPERRHRLRRLRVDDVGLEAALCGPAHALLLHVEADERGGGLGEARV
jgi:hypothetical protein